MSFKVSSMKDVKSEQKPVLDINLSTLEFNRPNIESVPSHIRLVDSDEENKLDLFCYINCNKTDPDFLKCCRGVVFNEEKLILKSFPYTTEYTENNNKEEISANIESIFKDCVFYNSYEGCLIRVFYFKNKWYISTNKKLDANRSKWSSKQSYGVFFQEALHQEFQKNEKLKNNVTYNEETDRENACDIFFESVLDKSKQYMFLLLNNSENRIVCLEPLNPTIYHVGTFVNGELSLDENIYIPYPEKLEFTNINDVYNYVDKINYDILQGVVIFAPNNIQYKILNNTYFKYFNARGNEPSIKFRYLQVRMDPENNKMLHELYPHMKKDFEEYENYIFDASRVIYNAYVDRFIKKLYVTVPVEEFNTIKEAHKWYLEDKTSHRITYEKIIELLNIQTPTNLNKIVKRLKLNKLSPKESVENKPENKDFRDEKSTHKVHKKRLLPKKEEKKEE